MDAPIDLNLSGLGKASGGKFGNVNISGFGELNGNVEAELIQISGAGSITGNTAAARIRINGTGTIKGDLETQYVENTGNFKVDGQATVKEWVNEGRTRIDGELKGSKIFSQGYLSVGNSVQCENFYSKGSFAVDNNIEAGIIEIEIGGFCAVKEILGKEILIHKQNKLNLRSFSKFLNPLLGRNREWEKLKCTKIEGERIEIEYTDAHLVIGQNIKIGPECRIDEVVFKGEIEVDETAWVGKQTKE